MKGKTAAERLTDCARSNSKLGKIAEKIGYDDFEFLPSVYFASEKKYTGFLRKNSRQGKMQDSIFNFGSRRSVPDFWF